MYAHRYTHVVTIELKPGQGALPPPPREVGALLVGWLLLVAAGAAAVPAVTA